MAKKRILVIDDEQEILRIICDLLTKNGYEVEIATSCEKALNLLKHNKYHTILTDIRMPEKSGIDILEDVKNNFPDMPVVMMTGYASIETAIESLRRGAFDYLVKPLDYENLKSIIKHSTEVLELREEKRNLIDQLKELNSSLELKVQDRNRQLINILNSTRESIITTDKELNIVSANPISLDIFGKECVGSKLTDLLEGINFNSIIPHILNDFSYNTKHEIKYGNKYLEIGLSQLIDYETKDIFGVVVVTEDISEKKKLEAQIIQSAKMSSVGQLASGIAHEFNNILTSIMGYTNIAMTRNNFEDIIKDLKIVETASDRAAKIINNLLTFSRPKKDKYQLALIDEIIEDTLLLIEKTFETEGIKILRYFGKIPPIRMNEGEIQQVILNLAINSKNAIKNTGIIKIKTEIEDDYLKIEFADTGCGIPKKNLSNIFDPFYSTSNDERSHRGTGLGLSIVYAIIERHHGKIEVDSEEGKGTTFIIKIPNIHREDNKFISDLDDPKNILTTHRKGNILVVDDDISICNVIKEYLAIFGHNVVISNDPNSAVVNIEKTHFDIVFLNYSMPSKNGLDVLKEIKLIDRNAIVIIITGKSDDNIKNNVITEGAFSLINKPFRIEQIQNTVAQILGADN